MENEPREGNSSDDPGLAIPKGPRAEEHEPQRQEHGVEDSQAADNPMIRGHVYFAFREVAYGVPSPPINHRKQADRPPDRNAGPLPGISIFVAERSANLPGPPARS